MSTAAGLGVSDWDKPWFCHDLDCPIYTVQEKTDMYEVRKYEAGMWVSTTEKGFRYSQAVSKGFWKLFQYIGGENDAKQKIAMTAPVRVSVSPGAGPFCEDNFSISFFVPYEFQSKAPTPSNEAVFLSQAPAFEAYVASYSGWNSDKKFTKVASELFEELRSAGVDVREDMYYTAGYDSPFRLINRHNEVWLLKNQEALTDGSASGTNASDVEAIHAVSA